MRIELGPRDIADEKVVVVRRDTGEKAFVPRIELRDHINSVLSTMEKGLWDSAEERLHANIEEIRTIDEGRDSTKILKMHWCGEEDCAREVETVLELTILGHPPDGAGESSEGDCIHCGKTTPTVIYASKTY